MLATCSLVGALCLGPLSGSAAVISSTWTGQGIDDSWNTPENWSPADVPLNDAVDSFIVDIPGGGHAVQTTGVGAGAEISSLSLALGSALEVVSTSELAVLGSTAIAGSLVVTSGSFEALAADLVSVGEQAALEATLGGLIDLQSMETFGAGANLGEDVTITASGQAVIDLSSVSTITSAGRGITRFILSDGGIAKFCSLGRLEQVIVDMRDGATFDVPCEVPLTYVTTEIYDSQGSATTDVLKGSGQLGFEGGPPIWTIASIDAGFDDGSASNVNVQRIVAENGARFEWWLLDHINLPARPEDKLVFVIDGGEILMPDLSSTSGAGSMGFSTGSGVGNVSLGFIGPNTNASVTGSLTVAEDVALGVDDSFAIGSPDSTVTDTLSAGGDFSYGAKDPEALRLGDAVAIFGRSFLAPEVQFLEVGGRDVGLDTSSLQDDNFGMGQLNVGYSAISATNLELVDTVDNSVGGGREALYLWGYRGLDGLVILQGSSLTLNGLNVYTWEEQAGDLVHINALFGPGETEISYGAGTIYMPEPRVLPGVALGILGLLARRRGRPRRG